MSFYLSEIIAFVCFFMYGSFFEWTLHKYFMHQPRWQYSFQAHAVVHHGLFRFGDRYFLSDSKDLKKVRFAWWNAPVIFALHSPVIYLIGKAVNANIFFGALAALGVYYFLYEYLHYCMHVPAARWLEKTAWFRWLDSHHHMHHKRYLNNLNVVFPLADLLFGSLIARRNHIQVPDRAAGAVQVAKILAEPSLI